MSTRIYNAIITEEDNGYVALNPEYDIASQGNTVEEALANLQEALDIYLEELNKDKKLTYSRSFFTTFSL